MWGTYIIYCQHNNNVKWGEGEAKTHNQLECEQWWFIHSFIHLRRNYLDWWGGRALILCVVHICSLWTNIPPISSSLSWRISFDGLYGVAYWSGIPNANALFCFFPPWRLHSLVCLPSSFYSTTPLNFILLHHCYYLLLLLILL